MPIRQRTSREDYPGSNTPVEQVLGWNYEPFTLNGIWDDRYMGANQARNTLTEFTEMVKRGNMVRISFEEQTFHGLITSFTPGYKLASLITYSFEVSPHYKNKPKQRPTREGARTVDPKHLTNQAALNMTATKKLQDAVKAPPKFQLKTNILDTVEGYITSVFGVIEDISTELGSDLADVQNSIKRTQRVIGRFAEIRAQADRISTQLRSISSAASLTYDSAMAEFELETWSRSVAGMARLQRLGANNAYNRMQERFHPQAKALYRPQRGESLYAISQKFYGTPHSWQVIAERNNLTQISLTGNELLIIPDLVDV